MRERRDDGKGSERKGCQEKGSGMTGKKRGKGGRGPERVNREGRALGLGGPEGEAAEGRVLRGEAKSAARSDGTDTHGQPGVERTVYAVLY